MSQQTIDNILEEHKKYDRLRNIVLEIHNISLSCILYSENQKEILESLKLIQNQLDLR